MQNNERQSMYDAAKTAKENADNANRDKAAKVAENISLKDIIGYKDEVDVNMVQDEFTKDIAKYSPDAKNYREAVTFIDAELKKTQKEHEGTAAKLNQRNSDYDNLRTLYDTVLRKHEDEKDKAEKDLADSRKEFDSTKDKLKQDMSEIAEERERIKEESAVQIKSAERKAEDDSIKASQIALRNEELTKVLADIRRDSFERPSGKIVFVNQRAGLVTIDLGSADGLMPRMTFSVYNPKITGISFGTANVGEESVICDICKRELKSNARKASIEVIKVLGPNKAEARILDDELSNPVSVGDVIHTPIWKPGQHQRFALASGMRLPGVENRDGSNYNRGSLETVKRLIVANGGIVDDWIEDTSDADGKREVKRGGKITPDTTYLVIGDLDEAAQSDQDMMKVQSAMRDDAKRNAVKEISLRELLTRMSYKNTAPVRGFGKYASEDDHKLTPTGEYRPSSGTVSPTYQLPNREARISPEDRRERPSTGTVAGLYEGTKSTTQSSGTVSELFRQRKPGDTSSAPKVETTTETEKD